MRYAIAQEKIQEVAREDGWGKGSPMWYKAELADDYDFYARQRSGIKNIGIEGCLIGCLTSIMGAATGAILGAILIKGDRLIGAGAGLLTGGLAISIPYYFKLWREEGFIEKIRDEYTRRKKRRSKITEAQKRSTYGGLIASESNRFDFMTRGAYKWPKQ